MHVLFCFEIVRISFRPKLIIRRLFFFQTLQKAEQNLDSGLREILAESGAEEFAPILAMRGITSKQIVYMKDKDLAEVRNPETETCHYFFFSHLNHYRNQGSISREVKPVF